MATASSILRATSVSSCAGAAPGRLALTVTIGNSMSGKSCTTLPRNDSKPARLSNTNSMIAGIGYLIDSEEKFIPMASRGYSGLHHFDQITVIQKARATGDHLRARL